MDEQGIAMGEQQTNAGEQNIETAAEIVPRSGADALRRYWAFGEGARLIRWGTPGGES
jgi:hypothetical protein